MPDAGLSERPTEEQYDIFGLSHPGLKRAENQDHFLIASLHKALRVYGTSLPREYLPGTMSRPRGVLALVADGVGGGQGGQEASSTALATIARYLTDATDLYVRLDPSSEAAFLEQLKHSVERSHEALLSAGADQGRRGMATTLTMVMIVWPRAFVVHVGDSRAYRLREGTLELVTHDQTMAQAMVDAGAITPEQAEASHLKHVLWSAVGGREAAPEVRVLDTAQNDMMLLCTDGITKHVTDDEIRDTLLREASSEATCRALCNLALERGGSDNITVIAGRIRPKG
jgi:protein phosphatase